VFEPICWNRIVQAVGDPVDLHGSGISLGDLRFHAAYVPACATCGRALRSGEVGWMVQGTEMSTAWGYTVRPPSVWCPACLEAVPRAEPVALD
jgi:hypothetical protein